MARRTTKSVGIPTADELDIVIAPDVGISPDALAQWMAVGKSSPGASTDANATPEQRHDEERLRRRQRRQAENERKAQARKAQAKKEAPRESPDQPDLVEVSSLEELLGRPLSAGKAANLPNLPGIDFGIPDESPAEDAEPPSVGGRSLVSVDETESTFDDYESYYYGSDEGIGGEPEDEEVDARDAFFSDGEFSGRRIERQERKRKRRRKKTASGGIRSVIKTPLASDFDPDDDDDYDDDEPRPAIVFEIPDSDDRPFSVQGMGRRQVREMSVTLRRFLDGDEHLGQQISALWRSFPEAYGITAGRQRYSGFAMRPTRSLLSGKDFGEATHMSLASVKSFDKFVHDLADGDPYAIEFLGVEDNDLLYSDATARAIRSSGDAFISKRCGEATMGRVWDLIRKIGRPVDFDGMLGDERRRRAIQAIDDAKEDFTEAYGRFAKIYVDVQNFRGRPTVMASLNLRDMPLSDIGDFSVVLSDIARSYGMMAEVRGKSFLRGEALVHAMTEVVRLLQTTSELMDGEGLHVYRDRKSHVLNGIMKGRLIGPDGRPIQEFWDIVDEEQIRLEDAMERTPWNDGPDESEVERLLLTQNRKTILEDA